ncbi:Adenine-specific DNA methylase [Planktothrix rubescens]|nr:Adenine-specific DNA methylase [Planktothrix rubescens]
MIYPKRLIEVDLPIKRISAHARREKSIRHGHISTLHIWWARRPLAACRAVICASLWIDPVDSLCPQRFRDQAVEIITKFARKAAADGCCSPENWSKWKILVKPENKLDSQNPSHLNILRYRLLDFIADFANWDNSTQSDYLETARALTQAAHEALGGEVGTRPLVVDPFAGGGSIPLEALRVGADAFASDLNPVAVLLNKVVLEYIPKYGQRLADEVRKWGQWVKEEAEKELGEFYPKDEDGSTPIAYLWARTIISEAPDDGTGIPVEVPLMRSLWLAKKASRYKALRWVRDASGIVQTETLEVTYADGVTRKVRRPLLEIFEPKSEKEVEKGTVARGSGTCPVTGFTTPVASTRRQLKIRKGGANDARLFCVVLLKPSTQGRFYRLPSLQDLEATEKAVLALKEFTNLDLIPNEPTPMGGGSGAGRAFSQRNYGMDNFADLFTPRQLLALVILTRLVKKLESKEIQELGSDKELANAIQTCLALSLDKQADLGNSVCTWVPIVECPMHLFGRQAIGIVWDFAEGVVTGDSSGSWVIQIQRMEHILTSIGSDWNIGNIASCSAISSPLPNDSANSFITDPPYYDAIPYADLSDFFYVWLKRSLPSSIGIPFSKQLTPKDDECIVDEVKGKDKAFFERTMGKAMAEGRRIVAPNGIGLIVFAHKSTAGWEAQLQAMIDAGWIFTGSWTIDTEMGSRLRAMNSAALASSVHLVCRPRSNNEIGDWRNILQELPLRIKEWMPRLTEQGVVGADAIFACLGPALEIFSRYSSVEKASGEIVPLREYLEYVWAAISKEALSTIFKDADTSNFEEDARLTAMWLWTLSAGEASPPAPLPDGEGSDDDDDDENTSKKPKITGFSLEYDTARKIAQGLGAHLENLTHLVEVKGDKARLLPVKERAAYLFGKEGMIPDIPKKKAKGDKQLTLIGVLDELPEDEHGEVKISRIGETICDKVHQAMLLFNSGRSEALKRFLVDEAIGKDIKFWQLAQSFSALYPAGTDEKRWVDGLLARKKGLGL